ncbi:MAG: GxxExxY protein [Lentisphaerota bacterium]
MNEKEEFLFKDTTEKIIKCFYKVFDELGGGFLESVYEKALLIELKVCGLNPEKSSSTQVKLYIVLVSESLWLKDQLRISHRLHRLTNFIYE